MPSRVSNEQNPWQSAGPTGDDAPPLPVVAAPEEPSSGAFAEDLIESFTSSAGAQAFWPGPEAFPRPPETDTEQTSAAADGAEPGEMPLSLGDEVDRQILATSPQDCELSRAAKNGDRVCGGAAVVNALILESDSPAARQANAAALKQAAGALGARRYLPDAVRPEQVDASLKAFAAGQMRPTDVQVLQQLAYASLRALQADGKDAGANPAAMGLLVDQLSVDGARLDGARFTLVTNAAGVAHWTATARGFKADSLPRPAGKGPQLSWDADVTAPSKRGAPVTVRLRGGGTVPRSPSGRAYQFQLQPRLTLPGGSPNLADALDAIGQGLARGTVKAP